MRLSEQIIDNNATDVMFIPAHYCCELSCDQHSWIHNHYMKSILHYKSLMDVYEKDKIRNKKLKKVKVFPSRDKWTPSAWSLTAFEKLLSGPSPTVSVLRKVQQKLPGTGRWITYTSTQCKRVSSSYVCVNHNIASSCKPIFGQITKLIVHNFVGKDTMFAELTLLDSSNFDVKLAMWCAKSVEDKEQTVLYVLQDLSQPLVVACEREIIATTCIWFLNYP